jgi:GAF domain-containing protein
LQFFYDTIPFRGGKPKRLTPPNLPFPMQLLPLERLCEKKPLPVRKHYTGSIIQLLIGCRRVLILNPHDSQITVRLQCHLNGMKTIPFAIVRRKHLSALKATVADQKAIISHATDFVKQIEAGNLDASYSVGNQETREDHLGTSLQSMRDKLKAFSLAEKQRHWVTEGIARFVQILRSGNDIHSLADEILRNLVRYMEANQGALYVLNDDNVQDTYLEMIGCYAYDRKKHLSQRIDPGQGITGQVFLEKETSYMTNVPANYIKITSGLGEALPRHLLIVPLKINEEVLGIVELACFQEIKPYRIKFVESIAESIASTISSVKTMARTKRLLDETQLQAEQMRAVEEEMRQNMEELTATQEEMARAQKRTELALKEVSEKENYLFNMLNASHDGILTVNTEYEVVMVNEVVRSTFKARGFNIKKGFDVRLLSAPGEKEDFLAPYRKAFAGEVVHVERDYFDHHYLITYNPIRNESGEVIGASVFTKEVTEQKKLQLQYARIQQEESARLLTIERNRDTLTSLVKNADLQNGNLSNALDAITKALSSSLGISRAAVWSYDGKNQSIRLEKMHLSDTNTFVAGGELFKKDIPTYFASVESEEVIAANDTFVHPSLIEFRKGYLDVYDIQSMLDVPFFLDGAVGGVICCENQKQQKQWSAEDIDFAKSVADLITVAYKSATAKKLLADAQKMAEELRAQEEELRQNMEELATTQEELQRQLQAFEAASDTGAGKRLA